MTFDPDPEYEFVEPKPVKRGRQCGSCGMKFDYNTAMAYYCAKIDCPMGWGPSGGKFTPAHR